MRTTKEIYANMKAGLSNLNTTAPIVPGVYKITDIKFDTSIDGKILFAKAIFYWRQFGTKEFDAGFRGCFSLNPLFNNNPSMPIDFKINKEDFKLKGSEDIEVKQQKLMTLKGKTIQIERALPINTAYGVKFQFIWNLYNGADLALPLLHPSYLSSWAGDIAECQQTEVTERKIVMKEYTGEDGSVKMLPDVSDTNTLDKMVEAIQKEMERINSVGYMPADSFLAPELSAFCDEVDEYEKSMIEHNDSVDDMLSDAYPNDFNLEGEDF